MNRPAIGMTDLGPLHRQLDAEIRAAIDEVIAANEYIGGTAVSRFEDRVASFLGVRHAIGVASGTDALILALEACGVGAGDEVVTSPFSFWATTEAILTVGARPVFVDISNDDLNIDSTLIEEAITPKTKAILPVHIFGHVADMAQINAIAERHNLVVIEDAAQAFGAGRREMLAGSAGLAGCFSFYPSKPLGGIGDGGMVVTNDDSLAQLLRRLSNHGASASNVHDHVGHASRLDAIQAAVLDVKLKYLPRHIEARQRVAARYHEALHDLPLLLPISDPGSIYAQYTVRCRHRDSLAKHLAAHGIDSRVFYPLPLYRQPALADAFAEFSLPVVEGASQTCLSLPIFDGLSIRSQDAVINAIHGFPPFNA